MKRFDQINMVPFIDIVLVLLAIVMTTASFVSKGLIEVDLPETESTQAAPADVEFKEITIDSDNRIFYQGQEQSIDQLDEQLVVLSKQTQFHLRVDKASRFGSFIAVADLLRQQLLDRVAIETVESL